MTNLIIGSIIMVIALFLLTFARNGQKAALEKLSKINKDDYVDMHRGRERYQDAVNEANGSITTSKWIRTGSQAGMALGIVVLMMSLVTTVPAGHVKVATLFGEVQEDVYTEGLQFPVNPLYDWHQYDVRQKTMKFDKVGVPSLDQLISNFDISVQFRLLGSSASEMKQNTGSGNQMIDVHLVPHFRSLVREQGKTVKNAEEFYQEAVQQRMQENIENGLIEELTPLGISVDRVLIRNVNLPPFIAKAVEDKKRREQEAEKQKAELKRFSTEQEQKIATANAEFEAAKLEEQRIRLLANAEAYKIKEVNKAAQQSQAYIELKRIEAWDGVLPRYFGGDGATPLLDLRNLQESK